MLLPSSLFSRFTPALTPPCLPFGSIVYRTVPASSTVPPFSSFHPNPDCTAGAFCSWRVLRHPVGSIGNARMLEFYLMLHRAPHTIIIRPRSTFKVLLSRPDRQFVFPSIALAQQMLLLP